LWHCRTHDEVAGKDVKEYHKTDEEEKKGDEGEKKDKGCHFVHVKHGEKNQEVSHDVCGGGGDTAHGDRDTATGNISKGTTGSGGKGGEGRKRKLTETPSGLAGEWQKRKLTSTDPGLAREQDTRESRSAIESSWATKKKVKLRGGLSRAPRKQTPRRIPCKKKEQKLHYHLLADIQNITRGERRTRSPNTF